MERLAEVGRAFGPWLPWLALLAFFGPAAFGVPLSRETQLFLREHGVAAVILLAVLAYVPNMVRAHNRLATAVEKFCAQDDYKHREVLGVLTVLAQDMRDVKTAVRALKDDLDGDGR